MKPYLSPLQKSVALHYQGVVALLAAGMASGYTTLALWGAYRDLGVLTAAFSFACFAAMLAGLRRLRKRFIQPAGRLLEELSDSPVLKKKVGAGLKAESPLLPVVGQINRSLENTDQLMHLMENVNSVNTFDGILQYIYETFSTFIPYSHIGIALLQEDGETLEATFGISGGALEGLVQRLVGLTARLGETSMGNILAKGEPRIIDDLERYTKRPASDYNQILLDAGVRASITLPLLLNRQPVGIIFFSSVVPGIYRQEHIAFLRILANSIAISLNKNLFIDRLHYSSVLALAKLAEARDEETGDHLERMKQYTRLIASLLMEEGIYPEQLNFRLVRSIERFSPMHDIGKVGVRDAVLRKPGKLTPEEFAEMKLHPIYGADVLRAAEAAVAEQQPDMFAIGIEIAESHHERWDGSGYPYGLAGEQIPLSARVVAVADVFDALTSTRVYKEAFSFEESFKTLLEGSGSHFDPVIIDCLARHKDRLEELFYRLHRLPAFPQLRTS